MTNARRALKDYERSVSPNMSNSTATATASSGFPVLTFATVVLFILKVAGEAGASWGLANISWWLVAAPVLFGFAIVALWILFAIIAVILVAIFDR